MPYMQWVQSILSHDPDSWTQLHEFYSGHLRRDIQISLRKWGLPLDIADDIEQETWLTAVRKIGEFTWVDEERFYHWLRSISCNHIRSYRRHQRRYVSFEDSEDEDDGVEDFMDHFMEASDGVEDQVILRERMVALDRVLRTLPPRDREILVRRMMGETPRDLAAEYGLKPEHVRTILLRSKKKLDDQLGTEEDSDE
jgi:RNA polymerase sigma factor (sigma-70 family)